MSEHIHEQLKAMFFGYPGSAKTYLIGTLLDIPEPYINNYAPILLLDFDRGQRTIRSKIHTIESKPVEKFDSKLGIKMTTQTYDLEQLNNPVKGKINRVEICTWEDFREIYRLLTTSVKFGTYKTLCIDTISQADKICQDAVAKNSMQNPFDVKPITQPEMQQLLTSMTWLIEAFLNTGSNLIVTAHITEKDDPGFTTDTNLPMLTTIKLRQVITAMCDLVGYTYTLDSKKFNVTFSKSHGQYAKFRAEDPSKIAGRVFSGSNDKPLESEFNMTSILKAIGDIK